MMTRRKRIKALREEFKDLIHASRIASKTMTETWLKKSGQRLGEAVQAAQEALDEDEEYEDD